MSFLLTMASAFSTAFLSLRAATTLSRVACFSLCWEIIWRSCSLSAFQADSRASHLYSRFFQSCSLAKPWWTWSLSTDIYEFRDLMIVSLRSDWFSLPSVSYFSSAFLSLWMRDAISDFSLFNSSSSAFSSPSDLFFWTSCSIRALISWSGLVLRTRGCLVWSAKLSNMYEFSEGFSGVSVAALRFEFN